MDRPRTLCFEGGRHPRKSQSLSPTSEPGSSKDGGEQEKYDEISEYIKEVDELLEFLKPFPRISESSLIEADSQKPGLDHLENLIRLVEQLKDLKDSNSQTQRKTQYLKDLKYFTEMKKKDKDSKFAESFLFDEPLPPPPDPPKKYRTSIPFRRSNRSKSTSYGDSEKLFSSDCLLPPRKSLPHGKAKISKWTKVKEAFRWEKATQLDTRFKSPKMDKKSDIFKQPEASIAEENSFEESHHGNRLQVPNEKLGDTPSPADSVLSGQMSSCSSLGAASSSYQLASSGYSGDHSSFANFLDLHAPPPQYICQDDSLSLSLQELSYSSDEEKFNELHSSELLKDNTGTNLDEIVSRRCKSLDGEFVLGPNHHLLQHLSKESLHDGSKSIKHVKTPWDKVKDIIHTRKGSLKKKTKKREDGKEDSEELIHSTKKENLDEMYKFVKPKIAVTIEHAPQYPVMTPIRSDCSARPLTPVFTLTVPSTEELQNLAKLETESKGCCEETKQSSDQDLLDEKQRGVVMRNARPSRWGKVKRAFLTSGNPEEGVTSSAPNSPLQLRSFFSDADSDDLSSGEWTEEKPMQNDYLPTTDFTSECVLTSELLKSEVQRNFSELQQKMYRDLNGEPGNDVLNKSDEKYKTDQVDKLFKKPRESLTIPLPTVEDLSPEFKKKLDEWKKIKKVPPITPTKEETQSHFISRIGEWPRWRTSAASVPHKTDSQQLKQEHHLQEEFYKKLEEWQMLKSGKRRSRSHSDRGKDDSDIQPPTPGLSRKNSKRATKKPSNSGKSSGAESLSGSLKEKEGRASRKSQKEKDLQWLEKELHKIEREKLRLEREKEKFLEREARLEQMKRTMGTTSPTQEVLIQTATGFFRFEGISQKFTKKLYEWEKARGIAPEASTFALLESASVPCSDDKIGIQRSKSVGSIDTTAIAQSIAHHPSSLSLNDVDDVLEPTSLLDASRASSEPAIECIEKEDEPEAIIVDVEDVVVETAALMLDQPCVLGEVPIYSYAPAEVTQLIDSSGSDGERETGLQVVQVKAEVQTGAPESNRLIEENIHLLERLEMKEAICREIENDLEEMQGKIKGDENNSNQLSTSCEYLLKEGENLENSFLHHSKQQQEMARDLVGNMELIHASHSEKCSEAINVPDVMELSSQLLSLSQKLELALNERSTDVRNIPTKRARMNRIDGGKNWYSTDESTINDLPPNLDPSKISEEDEVRGLPSLITKKVLELKTGLSNLKHVTEGTSETPLYSRDVLCPHDSETVDSSFTIRLPRENIPSYQVPGAESTTHKGDQRRQSQLTINCEPGAQGENMSPVNVTLSPPSWPNEERTSKVQFENPLEKSKNQTFFSENAEDVYCKNLRIRDKELSFEKKSPEALKQKIKEKILEMQRLSLETRLWNQKSHEGIDKATIPNKDDDSLHLLEDQNIVVVEKHRKNKSKKTLKTRRITDTTIAYRESPPDTPHIQEQQSANDELDDEVFEKCSLMQEDVPICPKPTPSYVFVPTSRKIISPVKRDVSSNVISYVIDDVEGDREITTSGIAVACEPRKGIPAPKLLQGKHEEAMPIESRKMDIGIPPLPNSPSSGRKLIGKDAAPSIRMMIAKYNQKITEHKQEGEIPSVPGNTSPVVWRSPILEKRIKDQIEKFQQTGVDVLRHGGKFRRGEVQKSASASFIRNADYCQQAVGDESKNYREIKNNDIHLRGVLKSSSTGTIKVGTNSLEGAISSKLPFTVSQQCTVQPDKADKKAALGLRALRIRQAKAEFLSRGPGGQSWTSDMTPSPTSSRVSSPWAAFQQKPSSDEQVKAFNRLSHVSVGSESSFEEPSCSDDVPNLIKSASAGMIHSTSIDFSRRSFQGSAEPICVQRIIRQNQTSDCIPNQKNASKFGISNIRSRFRRVKMRKAKEKESAVSTLCRQSLLLDVSKSVSAIHPQPSTSKSCPSSPVLERSKIKGVDGKKWMRYPTTFFKS